MKVHPKIKRIIGLTKTPNSNGLMDLWAETQTNAIAFLAAADYRTALKSLARNPDNRYAQSDADNLERFFRSGWYSVLTSVDGETLICRLREEARLAKL